MNHLLTNEENKLKDFLNQFDAGVLEVTVYPGEADPQPGVFTYNMLTSDLIHNLTSQGAIITSFTSDGFNYEINEQPSRLKISEMKLAKRIILNFPKIKNNDQF